MSRACSLGLLAATLVACGNAPSAAVPSAARLETAITAAVSARLGAPVVTRCAWPMLPVCVAHLPDGGELAVRVSDDGGAWTWHIDGVIVAAAQLETYVRGALDDLGVTTAVHCGPALRRAEPGERLECHLATGGAAWVTVNAAGTPTVELALDPAAAAARGKLVTPADEADLARQSHALEADDEHDDN